MTFETDNDRSSMLEDFGINIEIKGRTIIAIKDDGYNNALGVWVTVPVLTGRTIDWETYSKGDALVMEGVNYTIAEAPQTDGQGISNIILQRT